MTFIRYFGDQKKWLSNEQVEKELKDGEIIRVIEQEFTLSQVREDNIKLPPVVKQLMLEYDSGMYGIFRFETDGGVPQEYSNLPIAAQNRRHEAAYTVSRAFKDEKSPVMVKRTIEYNRKGTILVLTGTITALIKGNPVVKLSQGRYDFHPDAKPDFIADALVFDYIIGSGQRILSNYVFDDRGYVCSQFHHEAFTFNSNDIIAWLFARSPQRVSLGFWRRLVDAAKNKELLLRLDLDLSASIGVEPAKEFFSTLFEVVDGKHLGPHQIYTPRL